MNNLVKILIGALMVVLGVYSTVTFWPEVVTFVKAGIGPLLVLIGAFVVWLESDEWKMKKQQEYEGGYQQQFEVDRDEPEPDTGTTQQDVKEAVESDRHVCGECGREFDTQRGLSIHQTQKHGE